ncbi:class I SAM-dependent methyltransferase [Candidatus Bathyarchaeota archaeon]|jgi:ubiquinone/menaquinone biosynthesis C-methylase UbiE|nr:class I SAM-dependent methyltransferase [Candidatus Bathyarchaeota archaeon]MBT4319448.1 class I SAM-dependent methyltransferase [Candidatus Bathyarchaeota archaeon]MBT4422914.1 class I SAM-dependent methyltransferase [Candidatus Bathyarchaeota archaeon]MBT5642200.1 class I SAM-dependent methyltransferase [Candidatus Bathyarchaeota archaeon]MBT6605616.1 class I SAM-dependent methyltransferase [Candidatus Bathyarchaeota archaeon]
MAEIIDAFGEIYMAYYKGEPSNHNLERDDGLIQESADAHYYFRAYEEWQKNEQDAIKEVKGKILDIGLGAGRHTLYLQNKGHDVTGIDTSQLSLEVARLRGVKKCMLMNLHKLDFPDNSFDTVLMLGQNLGLGNMAVMRSYLSKIYDITTSDGIIIGEARDPSGTTNPEHLAYYERNRKKGLPIGLVKVRIGFQGKVGEWFDLFLMDQELLEEIVAPTGWKVSKNYYSEQGMYITILTK